MRCVSCGHENPDINRFCGMCGSILDRRRAAAGDNVVPMPARSSDETARGPEVTTPAAAREERKPAHLAEERSSSPAGPARPQDEGSFSIFGVDTGAPLRTSDVPQGLHGPSFLGLGEPSGGGDYLLDDEESHGGRKFLLVVVLLVVGGLAYLQYRADMPVTSIWAAIKSRATGQPVERTPAQEPVATGVQPAQPTSPKPDTNPQPDAGTNPPNPAANSQNPPANPNPAPADETKPATAQAPANPPDKNAAGNSADNQAAPAAKTPQQAQAQKPARGKAQSADMMAKAQRPQSDQDVPAQDEEQASKPARVKPSPAAESRRDTGDDALVARAQSYLYGRGGARSCNMAMSLLKQAAGRGNAKAGSQLGAMYATGNCAPFDRAEAYRWFSKAAEADPRNSYLQRSRDMMWREMSPQERHKVLE